MIEGADHLVLDGSVTLAWSLSDESSDYADRVLDDLATHSALVSSIWLLEVANGLLIAERRNRCTFAEAAGIAAVLRSLSIAVEAPTAERTFGDILNLGRAHRLSTYDAAYLDLAIRHGIPLATLDERLIQAAAQAGVAIYAPTGGD